MRPFDVTCYLEIRAKIAGVLAADHRSAIAAVEQSPEIYQQFARYVRLERPGERIAEIEYTGETNGYLVDVKGRFDDEESVSFDCIRGELVEMHREPGQGVAINRFQKAALHDYADGICQEPLAIANDLHRLNSELKKLCDPLTSFIATELAHLEPHQKAEAISRLDQAISDLEAARASIVELPEVDRAVATQITAIHADADDIRVQVLVDGQYVGTLYRERFASRTWRDSILEMNDGIRIRGLTASVPYLRDRFGIAPEITLQTHKDYYTIYDAAGVPFSRVMFTNGKFHMRELASGRSKIFNSLAKAQAAARAGLPR